MQLSLQFFPDLAQAQANFLQLGRHYYEFHHDHTFVRVGYPRQIFKVLCMGHWEGYDWLYIVNPEGSIYQVGQLSTWSDIRPGEIAREWGPESESIYWERINIYNSKRKKRSYEQARP
jgi:hypothetical protein